MHEERFDALTRALGQGASRRQALKLLGGTLAGGVLAALGMGEARADPPGCKRNGKNCKRDSQCCSGICEGGTCAACRANGGTCTADSECCSGICSEGTCTALPVCPGGTCPNFEGCNPNNPNCFCFTSAEGGGVCGCDISCEEIQQCTTSADCPDGSFCAVNTCCGEAGVCDPICEPDDTCRLGGAARLGDPTVAGPTAAGR